MVHLYSFQAVLAAFPCQQKHIFFCETHIRHNHWHIANILGNIHDRYQHNNYNILQDHTFILYTWLIYLHKLNLVDLTR